MIMLFVGSAFAYVNFPECVESYRNGSHGLEGVVDRDGNSVDSVSLMKGLQFAQCKAVCGTSVQQMEWKIFSSQLATWLLPWIALAAQLPFQTQSQPHDILSVLLVFGSPILAMYSLLLTLFNWQYARDECSRVAWDNPNLSSAHMNAVANTIGAIQQVPLEVQNLGLLACSIKLPPNRRWWKELDDSLYDTGRRFPASFWAQIGFAVVTYLFAIVDAFAKVGGKLF